MIRELELMCRDNNFDKNQALAVILQTDVNQKFVPSGCCFESMLLDLAVESVNADMVKMLLENGADPNQIFGTDEAILWNIQYSFNESFELNERRLKIAQMLLEYGANPHINPGNEPEDLFEWVWCELRDQPYDSVWVYQSRFFILLVAYGGAFRNRLPKTVRPFDKADMSKYSLRLLKENAEGYDAVILDENYSAVAYI